MRIEWAGSGPAEPNLATAPAPRHPVRRAEKVDATDATLHYGTGSRPLVFADAASRSQLELLKRIAPSDIPVLLRGDAGTGKEAIARYLHALSGREGPLVMVRCGGDLPEQGSGELSAETILQQGVSGRCEGWFKAATRGTLLLDDVGELTPRLQTQLVRILQNRQPIHAEGNQPADVRVISTTAAVLTDEAAAGRFRPDLLYRLNLAPLTLLPLARRRGDIAPLAEHFIRVYAQQLNRAPPTLSPDANITLTGHAWPGNIRELENVIRLALILAPARRLTSEHLRLESAPSTTLETNSRPRSDAPPAHTLSTLLAQMFQAPGATLLEQLEAQIVTEAFEFTGRSQVGAAALLGISRNVLRTLLKKHRLYIFRARSSAALSPERRDSKREPRNRD
jgi:DNA-binding NtrC family response regulator